MWECPDFFPLGHKQVLVVSPLPLRRSLYLVGTYADDRFVPENHGEVDAGGHFYAPQTLLDDRGRRLMWGWLWEGRSKEAQGAAGWAGVMSLPRMLTLLSNGTVGWSFVEELNALRGPAVTVAGRTLSSEEVDLAERLRGDALELRVEFEPIAAGAVQSYGLWLCGSPDGEERTRIVYAPGRGVLSVDRTGSSLSEDTVRDVLGSALALGKGEGLSLHIYVDHSVLEVIANGRVGLSSRVYPSREDSLGVGVFAGGGAVTLRGIQAWQMGCIW